MRRASLLCLLVALGCSSTVEVKKEGGEVSIAIAGLPECVTEVFVVLEQGTTVERYSLELSGGELAKKTSSKLNFNAVLKATVRIKRVSEDCPFDNKTLFEYSGLLESQRDERWELEIANDLANVFTVRHEFLGGIETPADSDCFENARKKILDIAKRLGKSLKGMRLRLRLDTNAREYLETTPDFSNPKAVTITLSRRFCADCANGRAQARRAMAHELDHATNITSPAGAARRAGYKRLLEARERERNDPTAENRKARKRARLDHLRNLRAEEERAYDNFENYKDRLGDMPAEESQKNTAAKSGALAEIDDEIRQLEQELQ